MSKFLMATIGGQRVYLSRDEAARDLEAKDKLIAELADVLIVAHVSWQNGAPISPQFEERLTAALSRANLMERNAPVTQIAAE